MRMQRYRGFLHRFLSGILIGIGCILPGVSGGVMAISFGLYRPALDALMTFLRNTGAKLRFLLPIALGGGIGLVIGAQVLAGLMTHSPELMLFLFMGFILGGVPDLWREVQTPLRSRIVWILLGVLFTLPLALPGAAGTAVSQLSPVQCFLTGLLEGAGTIIPGVSTSMVLIRLGWYGAYRHTLSTLLFPQLLWMGAGFSLSALACMHAVNLFFARRPSAAYSMVLGFLLGSVALIFPGFQSFPRCFAQLGLMVIGIILVRWLNQLDIPKR